MPNNPLKKISQERLKDPVYLEKIKKIANDLIERGLVLESARLADQLEEALKAYPQLANQAPNIAQTYQKLIIQLKWIGLPLYDDQTVLDLFRNHFLDALEANIDLNDRMTLKMYSVPDLVWPDVAQELLAALKENNQKIGTQTIAQWLKDYDKIYGLEKHSTLEQSEYLTRDAQVKTLSEEDKDKLKQLFVFYDNLKPLSLSRIEKAIKQFAPQLFKEVGPAQGVERPLTERLAEPPLVKPEAETPLPPVSPPRPTSPPEPTIPSPPPPPSQKDIYREPILTTPSQPKQPTQIEPRLEGNIVDLKGQQQNNQ